ncbi:MAG: hypothetical protein Kow0022_04150 [Phycisphaerales bacterium]
MLSAWAAGPPVNELALGEQILVRQSGRMRGAIDGLFEVEHADGLLHVCADESEGSIIRHAGVDAEPGDP